MSISKYFFACALEDSFWKQTLQHMHCDIMQQNLCNTNSENLISLEEKQCITSLSHEKKTQTNRSQVTGTLVLPGFDQPEEIQLIEIEKKKTCTDSIFYEVHFNCDILVSS